MPLTIPQITNQALQILEKEFARYNKPIYKMKPAYGKYAIYKTVGTTTTTVARRLSKEVAEGYMKLLEESDD